MNPNQPPYYPHGMPAVPRDHAAATATEILPFASSKISLARSPLTIFLVLAAIAAPFIIIMTQALGEARTGDDLARSFVAICFATVFFAILSFGLNLYFYAKPGRSVWPYLWSFALVTMLMLPWVFNIPFVLDAFMWLFRDLPGINPRALGPDAGFLSHLFSHFVAAGLMEELFKAIPIFIGLAVALAVRRRPGPPSALASFFRIRGPLDGALMGAFAGAAFIVLETAWLYLPEQLETVSARTGSPVGGLAAALLLYFPRVFGGAVGHMAYSAVFGYFIGLALLRPRQGILLILVGWTIASLLHALWNGIASSGQSPYWLFASALLSAVLAAAVILKGRQLQQSIYGESPETLGSILIDRSGAGGIAPQPAPFGGFPPYQPPLPAGGYPPPYPGYPPPHPPQGFAPPAPAMFDKPAAAPPPPFQPYVAPPPAPAEQPLTLDVGGLSIPIRAGAAIEFDAEPALGGKGQSVRGDVVPHPNRPGVLGLRNSGPGPWIAHLRDGRAQQIDRDQNVRLAVGVRIDFGDGLVGSIVARG